MWHLPFHRLAAEHGFRGKDTCAFFHVHNILNRPSFESLTGPRLKKKTKSMNSLSRLLFLQFTLYPKANSDLCSKPQHFRFRNGTRFKRALLNQRAAIYSPSPSCSPPRVPVSVPQTWTPSRPSRSTVLNSMCSVFQVPLNLPPN